MRKMLAILLLSLLTVGMSSCKQQEVTKEYKAESLVGTWELSSGKIFDREAKFLTDTNPKDEYGCGYMTWTYSTDKIDILNYVGKDESGNCLEEITSLKYTLRKNSMHTLDELGIEAEILITSLTNDELVVMATLPNPENDKENSIKYTELSFKRVK
ncbi:lipocalin family protein [Myroides sp. M-43]|uniref:lipocalin family protein n=1 Tax=Myroides oncorhynchi TaxID=2893756 RepID=UPI001E477F07|nr:lipocalin family protein [Myroides oncorhynchi]MCC9044052.1 lipocalin family protein [Myroides oncorhynchi]